MSSTGLLPVSKRGKAKYFLITLITWIMFIHAIFFTVFWYLNPSLARSTNDYLKNILKVNLPFIVIFMSLFGVMGIWALIRLLRSAQPLKRKASLPKKPLRIMPFLIASLVFLILFYASYLIIFALDHTQRGVMLQFLNFSRIATDLVLLVMIAAIIRKLLQNLWQHQSTPKWLLATVKVIGVVLFAAFWVLPVIFPPGYVYKGNLPTRPNIFAHRGASMIAPENTLIAAQLAANYGAFGFESDLRMSRDGVPFMMHDDTLQRTTDVADIFPDKENVLAEDLTLDELKSLNAGWWFLLEDPYGTVKERLLPQTTLVEFKNQQIPTLEEVLSLIEINGMVLMYDLRSPADTHPYYPNVFNRVNERIEASTVQRQVWLILDEKQAGDFRVNHPEITRVRGLSSDSFTSPDELVSQGYQVVNVDKGIRNADIEAYQQAGLKVNIYVVDEPWLFSQFWLKGVNSLTSNNIHELSKLNRPIFAMSFILHLVFWSILGILLVFWLLSGFNKAQETPIAEKDEVIIEPEESVAEQPLILPSDFPTGDVSETEAEITEGQVIPEEQTNLSNSEPDLPA